MLVDILKTIAPKSIKKIIRKRMKDASIDKYDAEFSYWKGILKRENGFFNNSHFKEIMLAIAEEISDEFIKGKIIADFGCGPRGSLVWAESAMLQIGIDVLAYRYER